jgi:hypothetical protein
MITPRKEKLEKKKYKDQFQKNQILKKKIEIKSIV